MKIKKEYIILLLILVALVAYLVINRKDQVNYTLPQAAKIDVKKITKMEIVKKDATITLDKKDATWRIAPRDYQADSKKIEDMLKVFEEFKITDLVSESKSYDRYDLGDDKKITVKAWEGASLVNDFSLGKTSPSYRHTFIKLANDDKVYQAQGNFRRTFEISSNDLRDKLILSFAHNDIKEIILTKDKDTITLSSQEKVKETQAQDSQNKEPEKEIIWKDSKGEDVDKSKVDNILAKFSSLKCTKFLEDKTRNDFKDPISTIVLKGPEEYTIMAYSKIDEEYPCVTNKNDHVFTLPGHLVDNIHKTIDEIMKKPDKPEKAGKQSLPSKTKGMKKP